MTPEKTGLKGYVAEESLRNYFRSIGYFVVRGIPYIYKGFDVSDVDLWLYVKATSLAAERVCVDIKNKKIPQAMERVLWTKGLKEILRVDRAIIVTTDNRPETRNFGAENGVGVLQSSFMHRVIANYQKPDRLSEEELQNLLKTPCVINSSITWNRWFIDKKAMLLNNLNFDGCNRYILAIKLLLNEYLATGKSSEIPIRLLYICLSYFLICLDYTTRTFIQLDTADRTAFLINGFRFGEAGEERTKEVVQMSLQLLHDVGKADLFTGESLQKEVNKQLAEYKAELIGEYFGKSESLKSLFTLGCSFDEKAYSKVLEFPNQLSSEYKSIIGLLCDLLGFDRKEII